MKKIKFFLLLFFFSSLTFIKIYSQQVTIYFDINAGAPYTLQEAIDSAKNSYAGYDVTIKIIPTYNEEQIIISDMPTNSLTIESYYSSYSVLIDVTNNATSSNNYAVKILNSNNVHFKNIDYQNYSTTSSRLVQMEGSLENIIFEKCSFKANFSTDANIEKTGVYVNSSSYHILGFYDCTFEGNSYSAYFEQSSLGGSEVDFQKCQFLNFFSTAIYAKGAEGLWVAKNDFWGYEGAIEQRAIEVENINGEIVFDANFMRLYGMTSNYGFYLHGFTEFGTAFISNNMISISGEGENHAVKTYDATPKMFNNSIYIPEGNVFSSALKIEKTYSYTNFPFIVNNIFDVNFSGLVYDIQIFDELSTSNNLFNYTNTANFANYNGTDIPTFDSWQNNYSNDINSIEGNPEFISITDLHTNNPIIQDAGVDIGEPFGLSHHDFDMEMREGLPDIGADEIVNYAPAQVVTDTTWQGTIYVNTNVTVSSTATLTIMPNTKVIFNDQDSISCYGSMNAVGTPEEPIKFFGKNGENWKGIYFSGSLNVNMQYVQFHGAKGAYGGAIQIYFCSEFTLDHCVFEGNGTVDYGGAIYVENSNITVNGCEFKNNYSYWGGGAIYLQGESFMLLTNSIFNQNNSFDGGDIFYDYVSSTNIQNNLFYGSEAQNGESFYISNSSVNVSNNIFWGYSDQDTAIYGMTDIAYCEFYNNLIFNGVDGLFLEGTELTVENIYNFDPGFVNEAELDFHLLNTSPCIDAGITSPLYVALDKDGNLRPFAETFPDIGVYEFQGYKLFSDAGTDITICTDTYQLNGNDPHDYTGEWSLVGGSGNFANINDPTTYVTNVQQGENIYRWSVSDEVQTVFSDIAVTNNTPNVYAGEDISLVAEYPDLISDTYLNGSLPGPNESGWWTKITGSGIVDDTNNPNAYAHDFERGESLYSWTISNGECSANDEVLISVGYNFYPDLNKSGLDWSNPLAWNVGTDFPSYGDSVTVYGTDIIVGSDANCSRLVISSSGELLVEGTAKAAGNISTNRLYIEQNAEKFPKLLDTALVKITNGVLTINQTTGGVDDGLIVGSKGKIVIEPLNELTTAELIVGEGRTVIIQEGAGGSKVAGNANVNVRNGGRLYIEQNAEKEDAKVVSNDVIIGSGGRLYIEQNAEKSVTNSEVVVGNGRRLYIEQNAEKGANPEVVINGGRLYIEQNAEKSALSVNNGVTVGNGGRLYIEQNAEKAVDSSIVTSPDIFLGQGGKIVVGSSSKVRGNTANIRSNRLYIEQNAEKSVVDTALTINPTGKIKISSGAESQGELVQSTRTAIQINTGGVLDLDENSIFTIDEGASFIDMNEVSELNTAMNMFFNADEMRLFSAPFNDFSTEQLANDFETFEWSEVLGQFSLIDNLDFLTVAQGYLIQNTTGSLLEKTFLGTMNTGSLSVQTTADNYGVNFVGNPYPSAVDWSQLNLNPEIQTAFYIYDYSIHNYKIFQNNGMNFYTEEPIIPANKGFFVISTGNSSLDFSNEARVHQYGTPVAKTLENSLIFNIENGIFSDKLGFVFNEGYSNNYLPTEDARELMPIEATFMSLSSVSDDLHNLTIDNRQFPDENSVVPVTFIGSEIGNYTISIDENNLTNVENILLKDSQTGAVHDFSSNPTYSFNYVTIGVAKSFELFFTYTINIDENESEINIYSNEKNIHISAYDLIKNVEIYTASGKEVIKNSFNSNKVDIQTNLPSGVYIVKAFVGDDVYTEKIIIE